MKQHTPFLPILTIFLVCLYPCAFSYLENAGEANARDMLPMLGIFLGMGLILYILSFLILRQSAGAGLLSSLGMLLLANSGLLARFCKNHLAWFRDRYLLLFLLLLLVLLVIFLKKRRQFPAWECCGILSVLFAALTLMRLIPAAPTLYEVLTFRPAQWEQSTQLQGETPNVYYFIVDEYGGPENLSRYYDFDNREFTEFLTAHDFNISQTSKNTESIWTSTIVPNLLNLDYVAEDRMAERVKLRFMDKPLLFRLFWDRGYQVNLISHRDFIGGDGCNVLSEQQFPDRISEFIFNNSVLALIPHARNILREPLGLPDFRSHAEHTRRIFSDMEHCYASVGSGPTLTVSYVQSPHYPFIFDAQGNPVNGGQNIRDQHFYLDQLQYLNTVLETSISNILEHDPDCLIVLQSDHGTRYPGQMLLYYGAPDYDPKLETPYMQNGLNCVYYRGESLPIEGETGINTWRLLLNRIYGTELPMLPAPEGYTCYGRSWQDKPKDFH